MIALAMLSVKYTMTGDMALAKMCLKRMRAGEAPMTLSALQYSSFFTTCTWPRTTRAKLGTFATPMAMITFCVPCPRMVMRMRASRLKGKAIMPSMMRMIMESTAPPKKPATRPRSTPMMAPTMVPPMAMKIEILAP